MGVVGVVGVGLAAALSGIAAAPPTTVVAVGEDSIVVSGMGITPISVSQPVSQSAGAVCLSTAVAGARVTAVELVGGQNLEVTDFAVTPGSIGDPGEVGTLDEMLAGHDRRLLAVCDPPDELSPTAVNTVNVQLRRTTDSADSSLQGYRIHWSAGSYEGSYEVRRSLRLCSAAGDDAECSTG